jgi:ubiquinone biosynthesis monooxygenase Coq7
MRGRVACMSSAPSPRRLPGDVAAPGLASALRIDHAGEYGAKRIYAGQLAVLKKHPLAPELRHMAAQEEVHLAAFNRLLPQHRARPSALLPLWHVAGYALGAATALLGARAAMACTVAVESVITEHYDAQLSSGAVEGELAATIAKFRPLRNSAMRRWSIILSASATRLSGHRFTAPSRVPSARDAALPSGSPHDFNYSRRGCNRPRV